jgi:predicted ribonuclease toxin of YeeF-YezG toxin-antitoxin module
MAMGGTNTVNITSQMMTNARKAIDDYRSTTDTLHTSLTGTVDTLLSSSFSGAAADGFKHFYTNSIEPAITDDLSKLLKSLEEITDEILKNIPGGDGLDDKLGEGNRQ